MARPSQDPAVVAAMDVIFQWNVKIGFNDGRGIMYVRPSQSQVEAMAKEMLEALRIDYDRRG